MVFSHPPIARRTKIVATLGPASSSPEVIRQLILAGLDVARLNFSHGTHEEHARTIATLRSLAAELDAPVTLLQDLQGPKIRVGAIPGDAVQLEPGALIDLVPEADFSGQPVTIPLDYAHAAEEARPGQRVLLADGGFELEVVAVVGAALRCRVVQGGRLETRKGVNFPSLTLSRLPSLTEKDQADLAFGVAQGVDWVSLSFVRRAEDMRELKRVLASWDAPRPVMAKIEKPQAIENLEEILAESDGVMVARGDLGVELPPERVPLLQKRIIAACNRRGLPVITATQMLESMVNNPRPTRAEASDVANAILDGTDTVMLSAESAVGAFPVDAVRTMDRIAREIETALPLTKDSPVPADDEARALCEGAAAMARTLDLRCIVALTTSGHTANALAAQRPRAPLYALTTNPKVYHALNLRWGLKPVLVGGKPASFEGLVELAAETLRQRKLAASGDRILVIGGVPAAQPRGSNFLKLHTLV